MDGTTDALSGRVFTSHEADTLREIILHRRDVRGGRFIDKPLGQEEIDELLTAALHAPSVGFSQPWEFVLITDKDIRQQVKDSFDAANADAQKVFKERQQE